jgi:hypothetical protein
MIDTIRRLRKRLIHKCEPPHIVRCVQGPSPLYWICDTCNTKWIMHNPSYRGSMWEIEDSVLSPYLDDMKDDV